MASAAEATRYDLVVFGASGFTGQYVVEELARTLQEERPGVTWAVAGRSVSKIQTVLDLAQRQTGQHLDDLPILIADVKSEQSLNEMCQKAKIVLNCVGPMRQAEQVNPNELYAPSVLSSHHWEAILERIHGIMPYVIHYVYKLFGDPVVRACIENGCHHLDISGEPAFLEKVQLLYDAKAKEKGVYIVGSCGWDSIPGEMLLQYTKDNFEGDLNGVEGYLQINYGPEGGRGNSGTWVSAVHGYGSADELRANRKLLFQGQMPKAQHRLPKRSSLFYNESIGNYCVGFVGADASVVRRTQRFNYEVEKQRPVQFAAYHRLPSTLSIMGLFLVGLFFSILTKFSFGRSLLVKFPGFFSLGMFSNEGPTRKQIEGTSFSWTFQGQGYETKVADPDVPHDSEPKKKIVTRLSGPEPGYSSTPICLVQAAYVLLTQKDKLPAGGGVLTPGVAFAKTNLMERLSKHQLKFEVVE